MATQIYTKLGLKQSEWNRLPKKAKEKLRAATWKKKPCDICAKPVQVLGSHEGPTWCLEHAGSWGE
jgi:hypothetical protein